MGNLGPVRTVLMASALVLGGAGALATAARAETLKLGHSTWVGYGPFFIARDKGYFKQEGVDVKLVNIEDPKVRFAALAAGRLQALATTVDVMPLYLKKNIRYQYLFALDDSNGGDGVVAKKSIKTIADLKGKKVAFNEGSVSQFYINVLLKQAGLSQSDIDVVNMTAGDAGSAFVAGRVDAAVTWEPWLSRGKKTKDGHLLTDSSTTPGLITDVVLAPTGYVQAHGKEFKALYRAWVRAVEFFKQHPDQANVIMAKGVGGWLKKPKVFAETLTGIAYYDKARNEAFFGTASMHGPIFKTVANAVNIWSGFGKIQVKADPEELVNLSIVGQ